MSVCSLWRFPQTQIDHYFLNRIEPTVLGCIQLWFSKFGPLDNGYAECLEGMRWTRLQRLILLPCNEQVRAANNRLLLIQRQIFEILDFMGPMGKVGRGDLSTSSHSAFRRSTTRISAELSGPRLVQGADKEINKIRRKSCLVPKKEQPN